MNPFKENNKNTVSRPCRNSQDLEHHLCEYCYNRNVKNCVDCVSCVRKDEKALPNKKIRVNAKKTTENEREQKQEQDVTPAVSSAANLIVGDTPVEQQQDLEQQQETTDSTFATSTTSGYTFTKNLEFSEISPIFVAKNIRVHHFRRTKYYGVPPGDDRIGGGSTYKRCIVFNHTSNDEESIIIFWTDIGVVETILPNIWILLCSQRYYS